MRLNGEMRGLIPIKTVWNENRSEDPVSQDLGFEEYLEEPDGVTVVEWPMFIEEYLPENALEITVTADEEGTRTWSVNAKGEAEEHLLKEWLG